MTTRSLHRSASLLLVWALFACAGSPFGARESAPLGPLPGDVRPLHYELTLEIVPERERFRGSATITLELDRPRRTLWLHGQDLEVAEVRIEDAAGESVAGTWQQVDPAGVAAVRLPRALGPGELRVHIVYAARFDERLRGLYRVEAGGEAYAFTQFQPIAARKAFPGFDEPGFKTPFDVSLRVPRDHVAIASTPVVAEWPQADGMRRIRFATTPPLPTYLLAWAVGPLDVVAGPAFAANARRDEPVPFRGASVRGQGGELAYALAHTSPLLAYLESTLASPYPYAKLDVIAVPDFSAGAMENVGAVTFRDGLLLMDPSSAPERQRRAFTYVMAHELAHTWFGNLVTMHWWDDLWLNEAFATWLGHRTVQATHPEQDAELALQGAVHWAMGADSLVNARRIRQPIESNHDIRNAFDGITYSKGAGVLAMFERWLGPDVFRDGLHRYLERHAEGNARAGDLLAALSLAAARDVATPFRTFLDQPGVPFVEAATHCGESGARLVLRQSRYLPVGSAGGRGTGGVAGGRGGAAGAAGGSGPQWQIPVCARYLAGGELREACTLLAEREGFLPLSACPGWVMPNAGGAGYYRWSQPPADSAKLRARGLPRLTAAERLSLADSLEAAFRAGTSPAAETYPALAALATDPRRAVATAPMSLLRFAREDLAPEQREAVAAYTIGLYGERLAQLGWDARPGDDGETRLLRADLVEHLAEVGRDPSVRAEAAHRGRRYLGVDAAPDPEAAPPELVEIALVVALQDGGDAVFETALARLAESALGLERARLLRAIGSVRRDPLAARARALALDPSLRVAEVTATLEPQLRQPETRAAAWDWLEAHFDELSERVGPRGAGHLPSLAASFCDVASAARVNAFLGPRVESLEGGPRNLAGAVEAARLCAALVAAQRDSAERFFAIR